MIKYLKLILMVLVILVIILTVVLFFTSKKAEADSNSGTNVDNSDYYDWSDVSSWWDFHNTHTVIIGTSSIHGYASSSIGDIALNCDSTANGNICSDSNFAVTNASGSGSLAGCAWNDSIGWISFSCADYDCDGVKEGGSDNICNSSDYQVSIGASGSNSSGTFSGYAWNDVEGWISFNCANNGSCGSSSYKVVTNWAPGVITGYLDSSTLDTGVSNAVLVSLSWQGSQPSGTSVDFQIATSSSSSGPWIFYGPSSATDYYGVECPTYGASSPGAGPDKSICVNKNLNKDFRYFRYRFRLQSDTSQTLTSRIDDIVVNFVK